MNKTGRDTVQAVPLIDGQMSVGAGTYKCNAVIHAETEAVISFPEHTDPAFAYTIPAGGDRSFIGVFLVASGTVTYS